MSNEWLFADLGLSRLLERAEAESNARFVETRASAEPESGACWMERAGACAMFDKVDSPLTQTFGLGLFAEPSDADLDAIEQFFESRGAAVFHEVSPLVGVSMFARLTARGYRPEELSSVLYKPLTDGSVRQPMHPEIQVRTVEAEERDLWRRISAESWAETPELAEFMLGFSGIMAAKSGTLCFLAEIDGKPIAAGALSLHGEVALLAGAATISEARGRGAQSALLHARLHEAATRGCRLASMAALPGSASQRNAERNGFRIAYTRTKFRRG